MVDIALLDAEVGTLEVPIQGQYLVVGFRRADHLDIIQVEYDGAGLEERLEAYSVELDAWDGQFLQAHGITSKAARAAVRSGDAPAGAYDFSGMPALRVPAAEFLPRLRFVQRHIVRFEGLEDDGQEVPWSDLDAKSQERVLRAGGPTVIWKLYQEIVAASRLSEARKND